MELKNLKATNRIKLWLVRMPLLVLLILLVLTVMEVLPSAIYLIISAGIFLITLLTVLIGRFHYVHISIKPDEVLLRHYHLFPLLADYQEILINKSDKPNFSLTRKFFGLIPVLNIEITTSQGKAGYSPIPLSLLSKEELQRLIKGLGVS